MRLTPMLVLSLATSGFAQQWSLDAQAGRIRSTLDPSAHAANTAVLGLRYDDALTGFRVSGGVPTSSSEPLWGAIGGARRLAVRQSGVVFGVDVAGNAFVLHDRVQRTQQLPGSGGLFGTPAQTVPAPSLSGSALAGQALPMIGYEGASMQAYLRAGVSQYSSHFGQTKVSRNVRMADAQLTIAASPNFAVIPAAKFYDADEGSYSYVGGTAISASGPFSVWGTLGSWLNQKQDNVAWAAGAALNVHRNASLNVSARHDGVDPLYRAAPQTSWNAGVTLHVGGKAIPAAPIPSKYENGRATLRLSANAVRGAVSIAGDFNDWKPQPMQRSGSDWTIALPLKHGVYNFAFVNDKGEWFVPDKYPGRKDDGMGGQVAVLVVQ